MIQDKSRDFFSFFESELLPWETSESNASLLDTQWGLSEIPLINRAWTSTGVNDDLYFIAITEDLTFTVSRGESENKSLFIKTKEDFASC